MEKSRLSDRINLLPFCSSAIAILSYYYIVKSKLTEMTGFKATRMNRYKIMCLCSIMMMVNALL